MQSLTSCLVIDNLNCGVLQATSGLLVALEAALKIAIAGGLGNGITPGSVDLNLHACSLVVHASITPPASAVLDLPKSNLEFSDTVLRKVADEIRCLKGMEAASACGTAINVRRPPPWAIEVAGRQDEEVKACVDGIFQKAKEKAHSELQQYPSISAPNGCNQVPEPPVAMAVAADSAQQLQRPVASDSSRSPKPRIPKEVTTMEPQDVDALECCWQLQGVSCNGAWAQKELQKSGESGEVQSRDQTSSSKLAENPSLARQQVEQLLIWASSCGQLDSALATIGATVPRLSSSISDSTSTDPAGAGEPSFATSLIPPTAAADVVIATDAANTQVGKVVEAVAMLGTGGTPSAAHQRQQFSPKEQQRLHDLPGNGAAAETTIQQKLLKGEANMAALSPVPSSSCADVVTAATHATPRATFAKSTPLEPTSVQQTASLLAHARKTTSTPRSLGSDEPSCTTTLIPATAAADVVFAKDDANAQVGAIAEAVAVVGTRGTLSASGERQQCSSGEQRHVHKPVANGGIAKTTTRQKAARGEANMAALPQVPSSRCTDAATAPSHATQRPTLATSFMLEPAALQRTTGSPAHARATSSSPRSLGEHAAGAGHRQSGVATYNQRRADPAAALVPAALVSLQGSAPISVTGDMDAKFEFCQGRLRRAGDALRVEHLRLRRC